MRARLLRRLLGVDLGAMADADAAPPVAPQANPDSAPDAAAVPPEAAEEQETNPDAASDAELVARAAALEAALRSGDSDAQIRAAHLVSRLAFTDHGEPLFPRSVGALNATGVAAALVQLISSVNEVGVAATEAIGKIMFLCDTAWRAVTDVDSFGVDALVQLLHESKGKYQRMLSFLLHECTRRGPWLATLSPDSDLVSRILSLPFVKTASASATAVILASVLQLLKYRPTFRRAVVPLHLPLLAELLALRSDESHDSNAASVSDRACDLLYFLQEQDDFDGLLFDEARVYVSCVELLGQLYDAAGRHSRRSFWFATRVLATAYAKCGHLRPRIQFLVSSLSGVKPAIVMGVQDACAAQSADATALVGFLDALRRDFRFAEAFLLDPEFAAFTLVYPPKGIKQHAEYLAVERKFFSDWRKPESLRALAQPFQHQKLVAAVTLAAVGHLGVEYRRVLASADFIDVFVAALLNLALTRLNGPYNDTRNWRYAALSQTSRCLAGYFDAAQESPAADRGADETPAKRQRIISVGGATLAANDVNVKRRDSTVLLIAGRPFYVIGALIETKSAVLADALRDVETLDPIAVALPSEVPVEQQYDLFYAAVEHAYTGTIASPIASESLLPLWCLADHLQMDELCLFCVERIAPALKEDAALLERTWCSALARPSDALCDACATAWLTTLRGAEWKKLDDVYRLFRRVHDGCAAKELPAAQLVRVLRTALLARIAKDEAAAARRRAAA